MIERNQTQTDGADFHTPQSDVTRQQLIDRARKVFAKKKLGQNFFVNPEGLQRITDSLSLTADDHVLEIGPGLGFLTHFLAKTKAHVTAVDLDREMVAKLKNQFETSIDLIHGDFLDMDLDQFNPPVNKIIGNVPYQITTPIIAHIFGEIGEPAPWFSQISQVVMTIQAEVAERLLAKPGSKAYSHLTILKEYFFDAEILFKVPRQDFFPIPEVTSAVVRLTPRKTPPVVCRDMRLFKRILTAGFKQRRKMLKNNLGFLKRSEQELVQIMKQTGINPSARAENLSIQQFALLADAFAAAQNES